MLECTFLVALREREIPKWRAVLALISISVLGKLPAQSNHVLLGNWKAESATETTEKGEVHNSWGAHPVGFLSYTEDGRMSAILTLSDRTPLSVSDFISAPANEIAEVFASLTASAGRYTFLGVEVVHDVEADSMANDLGSHLARLVNLDGDRLALLAAKPYLRSGIMVRF